MDAAAVFPIASFVFKAAPSYHISFIACVFIISCCAIYIYKTFSFLSQVRQLEQICGVDWDISASGEWSLFSYWSLFFCVSIIILFPLSPCLVRMEPFTRLLNYPYTVEYDSFLKSVIYKISIRDSL